MDPVDKVTNPTGKPQVDVAGPTAEEMAARAELIEALDGFDGLVTPGWFRRQWDRFVRFLRRNREPGTAISALVRQAEPAFDDLYDEILGLAGEIDAKTDALMDLGQRKKVDAQQRMDALARQITLIDADLARMIGLGNHAQALQAQVRAAREQD